MSIAQQIATELQWDIEGVKNAIDLFAEGNSLHFIARYRKAETNNMDSEQLKTVKDRAEYLQKLKEAKEKAKERLREKNVWNEKYKQALDSCETLSDVSDLVAPFKSKRKTRANKARSQGFQPLADVILGKKKGSIDSYLQEGKGNKQKQIEKALDIVAEESISHPKCKRIAEQIILNSNFKIKYRENKDKNDKYSSLVHLTGKPSELSPHQVMAIFRAIEEDIITFSYEVNDNYIIEEIYKKGPYSPPKKYKRLFVKGLKDGIKRLLIPRAERSVNSRLKEDADKRAIHVFKKNLENLLLRPPIKPQKILAIDPGYKNGCKFCVLDEFGKLLDTGIIYPNPPKYNKKESGRIISDLIETYQITFIAIGNGKASSETVEFVKKTLNIRGLVNVNYAVIPETGASVYSVSKSAREEFPDIPSEIRGAISIGRRILDPLNELVKIDPKALGIGQYQHDVNQTDLEEALNFVMAKCINLNGIDLLIASKEALSFISGLSDTLAERIVDYRDEEGFDSLHDLYKIQGIGDKTFTQAAGFLRLLGSRDILDQTLIHPEDYDLAKEIIEETGKNVFSWEEITERNRSEHLNSEIIQPFKTLVSEEKLEDIIEELILFGRDPRGVREFTDKSKQPASIEELKEDMELYGEVRNVLDFGAFVDLGIKENGLVHISNMADRFVSNPHTIVKVGDQVKVRVLSIDVDRERIGLELLEVNGELP